MDRQLTEPWGAFEHELGQHLCERYGIAGSLTRLGSERDETFRVSRASTDDVVVKVCAPDEPLETVDLQLAVAGHLAQHTAVPVPVGVPSLDGAPVTRWRRQPGWPDRTVYVLACLPGASLAEQPLSAVQAERVGAVHGELTAALTRFHHPAAERQLLWDMSGLGELAETVVSAPAEDRVAASVIRHFTRAVVPVAEAGARQVVHGDYSVHNVLADPAAPGFVTGVIDFGDVHVGPALYDLAVAVANLLDHRLPDPWSVAAAHVRGYLALREVPEVELRVLGAAAAARCVQRALIYLSRATADPARAAYAEEHSRHDWVRADAAMQTLDVAAEHFLAAA